MDAIANFCERWKVREFAVFGSILRDDFRDDSDVDVLVSFDEGAVMGLFAFARAEMELESLIGRDVDLTTREGVEEGLNERRKEEILSTAVILYAA